VPTERSGLLLQGLEKAASGLAVSNELIACYVTRALTSSRHTIPSGIYGPEEPIEHDEMQLLGRAAPPESVFNIHVIIIACPNAEQDISWHRPLNVQSRR